MNKFLLIIGIVCSFTIVSIQYASAWNLDVSLTNPPFGVKNVEVKVRGPFGWENYKIINWQQAVNVQGAASGIIHVYFTIPPNVIPLNYRYEVWTYNLNDITQLVFPTKMWFIHTYEPDEHMSIEVR